jgi:hypothetical protein
MASIAELIGLGTPVAFAVATFGFFHWLDEKASEEAKAAITGWFKPLAYDRSAVAAAFLELFDKIYGHPLLSWRSLARSSIITVTLTIVYAALYTSMFGGYGASGKETPLVVALPMTLIFNILTDYISLFVVRRLLQMRERSQIFVLVSGASAGICVILVLYALRELIIAAIRGIYLHMPADAVIHLLVGYWRLVLWSLRTPDGIYVLHSLLILPALATHIWLPLLAIGVALVKAANYFLWSVDKMQWFLKQGHEHPLEAIGYVAAAVVLGVMAVVHWI